MNAHSDFWLARTYYCASTWVTCWIALADVTSRHNAVFSSDGLGGLFAIGTLMLLAAFGVWDVVLEQCIKFDAREYRRLKRHRWVLFILIAGGHGSLLFASLMRWIVEPFLWRYVVDFACGLFIAVLLVRRRHTAYVTTFR